MMGNTRDHSEPFVKCCIRLNAPDQTARPSVSLDWPLLGFTEI